MPVIRLTLIAVLLVLGSVAAAGPAAAEWLTDLYAGASFTQSHDVKLGFQGKDFTAQDAEFDTSATVGGRFGYWIDPLPVLGVALDVFHFRPDVRSQTVKVCGSGPCFSEPILQFDMSSIGISLDIMARLPLLTSPEFPTGRLNPYVTAGPALFITQGKDLGTNGGPITRSNTDQSLGFKAGAGMAYRVHRNIALFAEYRFTMFDPEFKASDVFAGSNDRIETRVSTHHAVVGISLRY